MPGMDGLQVLSELGDWPGARVLLTGPGRRTGGRARLQPRPDRPVHPQADAGHLARLIEAVEHLLFTPHARHAQIWRTTLTQEQSALLRNPGVDAWLTDFCLKHWVEHVVIGAPFGVLGMDAAGKVAGCSWRRAQGLQALAELAELAGVPPPTSRRSAPAPSWPTSSCARRWSSTSRSRWSTPSPSAKAGGLLGAVFAVETPNGPDPDNSYSRWLARQPKRHVQD